MVNNALWWCNHRSQAEASAEEEVRTQRNEAVALRWPQISTRVLLRGILPILVVTQALMVNAAQTEIPTVKSITLELQATHAPVLARELSTIASSSSESAATTTQQTAPSILSQVPQAFDTSIGNNFTTSSCPAFFNNFLDDPVFQNCTPFSLLLQVSPAKSMNPTHAKSSRHQPPSSPCQDQQFRSLTQWILHAKSIFRAVATSCRP